jgi:hypothetical protein
VGLSAAAAAACHAGSTVNVSLTELSQPCGMASLQFLDLWSSQRLLLTAASVGMCVER